MPRSIWKPVYESYSVLRKYNKKGKIFIWSRASTISSNFLNKRVFIYNGKSFIPLYVKESMLGHKYGEFIFTKRMGRIIHRKSDLRRNRKRNKK